MPYPSEKADILETYVRAKFGLSPRAQNVYCAFRWLERDKAGLCAPVFAGYRDISRESGIGIKFVKPALLELQEIGLVKIEVGSPIKRDMRATCVQRVTLEAIKARSTEGEHSCHMLTRLLNERPFLFDGTTVKPHWTVSRTGRVMSSKPNFQGKPASERIAGLRSGLRVGQLLIDADIRQAEPTVIKFLLEIPQTRDLYVDYMTAAGADRPAAKKAINTLAYCRDSLACFGYWPQSAQGALRDYVDKLTNYKTALLDDARHRRGVTSITGRFMPADSGKRLHAGIPLNWRVQGSIADVVNAACLRLLSAVVVVVPIHDAILAVVPADIADIVGQTITDEARKIGLIVEVKEERYGK